MPCKLQNLSGFSHLIKICPAPKQDEDAYAVWYGLTKFAGKKVSLCLRTCITEMMTEFFAKYAKICPERKGSKTSENSIE